MEYNEESIRSKYQIVPRTLIFIRDGNRYLFIDKKKRDSFGYKKLNGIGGHIERGEEPFESARREIKEEAGLNIETLEHCATVFIDIGINPGILMFVFSADHNGEEIEKSSEGDLVWLTLDEIENEDNLVKDVPFLLQVITGHQKGQPAKIIKYLYDENKELRIVV